MIIIIDYEAGNIVSVKRALDYLKIENKISNDPQDIKNAERIIFPGVGHAHAAMAYLNKMRISEAIISAYHKKTPILGICLGTQIILTSSEEGETECLDLIKGKTVKFKLENPKLKVPHMGWNNVTIKKPHYLLKDVGEDAEFYFVHSYYPQPEHEDVIIATTEYELEFPVVIGEKNLIAMQFHPEKSAKDGLMILENFNNWEI